MFTEKIKDLRKSKGLNKRQMSELLEMPYTTYNNYETGTREPNSDVLKKISKTFGVSVDYLIDNTDFIRENPIQNGGIGTRIKQRREELGYTQPQLAELVGVSKGAIGNYESNVSSPNENILLKLFDVLQCDANFLYQDNIKTSPTNFYTEDEKQHIKKYRLLDQHGQKAVDSVLHIEYERCSNSGGSNNLVEIPYVARSETGERGTLVKTQEEVDEFLKNLNPDTSGRY